MPIYSELLTVFHSDTPLVARLFGLLIATYAFESAPHDLCANAGSLLGLCIGTLGKIAAVDYRPCLSSTTNPTSIQKSQRLLQ
jgi:hypothetical protein